MSEPLTHIDPSVLFHPDLNLGNVEGVQDVCIVAPPKSGTNWVMNVAWQLVSGASMNFECIYEKAPWLEFRSFKEQTNDERVKTINETPATNGFRLWKTHMPSPPLPFRKNVKYVVVIRNPIDVNASWFPFSRNHNPEFLKYWGLVNFACEKPSDAIEFLDNGPMLYPFIECWLKMRKEANVSMHHYADLLADLPAEMRRLEKFLGLKLEAATFAAAVKNSSFAEMKREEHRYEAHSIGVPLPGNRRITPLMSGSMVRKGANNDGKATFSPEQQEHMMNMVKKFVPDETERAWVLGGSAAAILS